MEENGIKIEGYLGKPVLVRSNRNFEIYFINGRFIRSGVIAKAIEEGYKQYLMQHKFPLCVLHITDGYGDRGCERTSLQNGCAVLRRHGICQNAQREDRHQPCGTGK